MWYKELDERYNFLIGQTVIDLSTSESLEKVAKLDPPYLTEYKEFVNCNLQERTFCKKLDFSGNIDLIHFTECEFDKYR